MTRTSQRAVRPVFDDLEGRHLLSTLSPGGRSPSAPAFTTHLARSMSVEAHGGLVGMTHQENSRFANLSSAAAFQGAIRAGTYHVYNKATHFNLDSNSAGHVYTLTPNTGAYQKWTFRPTKPDDGNPFSFYIVDDATGLYLDSNYNGDVYTLPHNRGSFQKWLPDLRPDGYYYLFNIETGRVLDNNSDGRPYTLPHNSGSFQGWRLTATTP